jgi:hypothetical protein
MEDQKKYTIDLPKKDQMYFGVDWDIKTAPILNAIIMDILNMKRMFSGELVVVCKEPKFLKRVCNALGLDVKATGSIGEGCKVWKLYYEQNAPSVPNYASVVYEKKVSIPGRNPARLTQGDPRYPSLYNYQDNIALPPGLNPNINRVPPRTHTGLPVSFMPYF